MRPRRITDETITTVAGAMLRERGCGVPLVEIAKALGVTQAGLLNRVGSKEALLASALCPGVPEVFERLQGPVESDKRAQLRSMLDSLLAFLNQALPALNAVRFSDVDMRALLPAGVAPSVALRGALVDWMGRAGLSRARWRAECAASVLEARALNRHLGGTDFAPGDDASFLDALVDDLME